MDRAIACMTLLMVAGSVRAETLQFPDPSMLPPAAQGRDDVPLPPASIPATSSPDTASNSTYVYPQNPRSATSRAQPRTETYTYPPFPAAQPAPNTAMPAYNPTQYFSPNALFHSPSLPALLMPTMPHFAWSNGGYRDRDLDWQGRPHDATQAMQAEPSNATNAQRLEQFAQFTQALDALRQQQSELVGTTQQTLATQEQTIADLKRQLTETRQQKDALEAQLTSLKHDHRELEHKLTALQAALTDKTQRTVADQSPADNAKPADTDNDGVPDVADLCADSAANTEVNPLGCSKDASITLKGVNFEKGAAILTAASLPVLDNAANTLKQHPNLKIEVGGHTDSSGDAATNQKLSQARAEQVMHYFIDKGVPAARLSAKGYGATAPLADNTTAAGKAQNRRVELKILP